MKNVYTLHKIQPVKVASREWLCCTSPLQKHTHIWHCVNTVLLLLYAK